jgi:hypothetical protein
LSGIFSILNNECGTMFKPLVDFDHQFMSTSPILPKSACVYQRSLAMGPILIEDLGTIRFISIPLGGAPIWVREQWVGLEIPCLLTYDGVPLNLGGTIRDVETGFVVFDYPGYIVLQVHALEVLERKSPEAVEYWRSRGCPETPSALFIFNRESAEVVKPVKSHEEFSRQFNDS